MMLAGLASSYPSEPRLSRPLLRNSRIREGIAPFASFNPMVVEGLHMALGLLYIGMWLQDKYAGTQTESPRRTYGRCY